MARTDYSGKRGSNAGDDFHELWAARRALELVAPGSNLVGLTVEGVSPDDAAGLDAALWDGVDAAFYYGSDLDAIKRVELVQFKYSGSDPDASWTVARLAYASNKAKTNALIARLASAWQAMRTKRPELAAADGIFARLVSNQAVAQEVLDAVSAETGDPARERLQGASGLSVEDFPLFLAALDFTGCGGPSRFSHEERVIRALSALKDGDVRAEFAVLREYIRKRMRPEGADAWITAESIYGLFGHADERVFYPCQTRVAHVEHLIPRTAAGRIHELFAQGARKLCLAGGGGEGKTTCLQDLAARLPKGSELVVYDCYGEGTYLNSDGYRHRAEDGFLQLANDASARLLLPPLFVEQGVDHPRRFANKLAAAAEALAARDPEALLVVAVDAADNAVTAAAHCIPAETAFVHDFARLGTLPANVRLLLSARTGRLPHLGLPDDVTVVELGPFSAEESRVFSSARLGEQSDDWHAEFHAHSGGNPRVQRYAIEFAGGAAERALEYLKPNGKNLDLIFDARLKEARAKAGGTADLSRLCAALILLPRPVPLDHLAAIVGANPTHVRDLALDLAPGLVIVADRAGFADEDFEQFVREAAGQSLDEVGAIAADRLMAFRTSDAYASTHAASLALLAGRREDVIALVREPVRDYPIGDPALRGDVHRRRLRAAMHVCRETGNAVEAAALLLEGAQAIKTDEALHRTLREHVELAANFSRDALFALILRDRERRPAHGALLLQLSGIDGLLGDRIGMRAHFRSFHAWQESRAEATEEDDEEPGEQASSQPRASRPRRRRRRSAKDWPLDADDVAAMIVGHLHAEGADRAADLLRRPKPLGFRRMVLRCVIRRLARRGDLALLEQLRAAFPARHLGRPAIELVLGLAGQPVDASAMAGWVERVVNAGQWQPDRNESDFMPDSPDAEDARLLLDACDLLIVHRGEKDRIATILGHAMPDGARTASAMTGYAPRGSDAAARAFALAKVLAGEPVRFDQFLVEPPAPPKVKRVKGKKAKTPVPRGDPEGERARAKDIYEPILALHEVRARILTGGIAPTDAPTALAEALRRHKGAARYRSRPDERRARDDAVIRACLPLGVVPGIDTGEVFKSIAEALGGPPLLIRFGTMALLEHASLVPGFRDGIVELAVAACEVARVEKISAEEKIDYLTGLAKLLLPIDTSASGYCFDAAMGIAGEVDYDTLQGIAITANLARRSRGAGIAEAATEVARRLTAVQQDAAIRLGSSDHFPWDDVAVSLTALAPQIALAAAARFAELDLTTGRSFLASVLEQCVVDGALSDEVLCAFLPILGDEGADLIEHLLAAGVRRNDPVLVDEVARWAVIEPCGSLAKQAAIVATLGAPGPGARELLAAAAFEGALPKVARQDDGHRPARSVERLPEVNPALFKVAGIDGAASFLARIDEIIAAEAAPYAVPGNTARRLLANVPPHRIAEFLDILVAIPEGNPVVRDLAHMLLEQLDRWAEHPAAARWAREKLLAVIETRLPELAWNISYREPDLVRLIDLTEAPIDETAQRLLGAIEQHIGSLGAYSVYRLVGLLSGYLTPTEAFGVLKLHTEALHARLAPEDRHMPGFETLGDIADSVSRFVYAELGHIAQSERWRAAHALRVLGRLGQGAMLDRIGARYSIEREPAFSHPEAPFYFLAARLWFMLALARLAWEAAPLVLPWREWLFEQAERADFPHLLIRQAAKHALNGLVHEDSAAFNAAARARIARINTSPLALAPSSQESWHKGFDRHQPLSREGRRFRFDSLDTLPYWYTPLLRCFADPDPADFLDRAERWIVDRWGVTDEPYVHDRIRGNARFNRTVYGSSSHGHGSLPAIERYDTHLEWNALFLAGGEVLAEWPLTLDADDDDSDSFARWLKMQGPTLAPLWLSDLRGPKPFQPLFWQAPEEASWVRTPTANEIRTALGLDDPEWLIVSCSRSIRYGELHGSVRSESSLVSPKTATALRLALEASKNSYQYRLAVNDDDDHETDTEGYMLKSILVDHQGDTELDLLDPLRGEVRPPHQVPHPRIVDFLELSRDPLGLPVWRDRHGIEMIKARAWSDPQYPDQRPPRDVVQGEDLLFRRSAVARMLEAHQLDMITEVTFNRRIGESSYGRKKDSKREREFDRLFVFRKSGAIETRARGIGRW